MNNELGAFSMTKSNEGNSVGAPGLTELESELLACLVEAVEDSEEVLNMRLTTFGERYRPWRLASMRKQIDRARAAILKATTKPPEQG